jgi:quinoprotein glucose dehydrogenase
MPRAGTRLALPCVALLCLISPAFTHAAAPSAAGTAGRDWPSYLGDQARTHYSTLARINRENVGRLKVAWTFDTGTKGEYQANNLVVDGVLYTAAPDRRIIALDAATGRELWRFDPRNEHDETMGRRQRGVMYWADGDDRRLFTPGATRLYALDARTGKPVRSFGENGSIALGTGLRSEGAPPAAGLNTPGVIWRDLLILSANVAENVPGAVRAFDARTGALRWVFHTIPRPGEAGHETWPADAWKTAGGASAWSGLSLDEGRGIIYAATETAGPDFWGGRRYGENLYANSLIALDAQTGRRLWHHQLVHHDLWDMDLPAPPTLLTVKQRGRRIDAVAQGTKMGRLFVFDRVTGEPLWPMEERPAPASEIPGVRTWPTQPHQVKPAPLMRQIYSAEDVSDISPAARQMTTDRLARAGAFGSFPPLRWNEAILFPGFDGGFEWGGSAADPDGVLYANLNEMPWIYQLVPTRRDGAVIANPEKQYLIHCGPCHRPDQAGDPANGIPSLVGLASRKTRDEVARLIAQGAGRMPPMSAVPAATRETVLDHLFGPSTSAAAAQKVKKGKAGSRREADDAEAGPPYTFGGFRRWLDAEGYPAIKPPWGTLNAVDLNTGEIKWKVPLGEYKELTARGIPPTGTENYGGPVVTAGGLIFIGATADETFRAFDKETGKVLWQAPLPFGGNATPSTYEVNGRQYVVISAGGGKSGRPSGGMLVAFALPE